MSLNTNLNNNRSYEITFYCNFLLLLNSNHNYGSQEIMN